MTRIKRDKAEPFLGRKVTYREALKAVSFFFVKAL